MKRLLTILLLLFVSVQLSAQRETVLIDPQTRKINQGNLLPAAEYFDIQIPVSKETVIIKAHVYKGKSTENLLEDLYWTRPINFSGNLAELPVSTKLNSNSNYSFEVRLYTILSDAERLKLKELVKQNIHAYLTAILESDINRIDIARGEKRILADLNEMVIRSLDNYQNIQEKEFKGFSDIVKLKIQQLDNARLKNASYNVKTQADDSLATETEMKARYASDLIQELEQIVWNEANNYMNLDFVKLSDMFAIRNQFTEKTQTLLPLFIGYGGVYLDGDVNDLEYSAQPYAGISFPLGSGSGNYFSRTSFVLGVFINNLEGGDGATITGPIVNRPVFAGLGFRIFEFLHLNAGAVATSTDKVTISNFKSQDVSVKPFVGLSAQFNLWLGFGKK